MNNDDDDNGGGTLVIDVTRGGSPAHPSHQQHQQQGHATIQGQPLESPSDNPLPTQMLPTTDGPYTGAGPGDPSADVERFFAHQRAIQGIGPAQLDESSTLLRNKGTPASSQPMLPVQGSYTMPVPPTGLSGTQNLGGDAWRAQVLGPQNEPSYAQPGQDPSQSQPYPSQQSQSGNPPPFPGRDPSVPPAMNPDHQRMLSEQSTIVTRRPTGGGRAILIGGLSALILGLGVGGTLYMLKRKDMAAASSASANAGKDVAATSATTSAPVVTSTPTPVPTPTPTPSIASTGVTPPISAQTTDPPPTATPPTATTPSTSPPVTSPPTTPPTVTPPVASGDADTEAKDALKKLQTGLAACVKSVSHVLPATSPSVPGGLSVLKRGPYEPTPRDWQPSFYTCTQFKLEQPMRFMIQWQLEQPNWRGSAIAWIDADGDGTAEKAYAFWAELKGADNVEFGPIESVDPERRFRIPR